DHHVDRRVRRQEEQRAAARRADRHLLALRRRGVDLPLPAALHREITGASMSAESKHETHAHGQAAHATHSPHDEAEHIRFYTKVYFALIALFLVSVAGPVVGGLVGSKSLVLVTAFGIAIVKAYLVCAHFM